MTKCIVFVLFAALAWSGPAQEFDTDADERRSGVRVTDDFDKIDAEGTNAELSLLSTKNSRKESKQNLRRQRQLGVAQTSVPLPGKRGIAFQLGPDTWYNNLPKVLHSNAYWCYSWNNVIQPDALEAILAKGMEWIPMIYEAWTEEKLKEKLNDAILPQYELGIIKRVLAFNEPDLEKESNMELWKLVKFWPAFESLREKGMPVASPALANNFYTYQKKWINHIKTNGYEMDYIAVHWYGPAIPYSFKRDMEMLYELYGSRTPLMITEFAPTDWNAKEAEKNHWSRDQVLSFMKQVLPWLESRDWIIGYSWFSFSPSLAHGACSSLYELDGTPTELGLYYSTVTTENPSGDKSIQISR